MCRSLLKVFNDEHLVFIALFTLNGLDVTIQTNSDVFPVARTAQAAPYAHYTCHLCGSALRYHPQYDTELPWFEHTDDRLTEHGQQCPYVRPERREIQLIKRLQQFVPDALPVVRKASWHCRQCHHDYYGERYCTHCQTGRFSEEVVAG